MTPEEYEIAFCKGKRMAMEFFNDWLKDHLRTAHQGLDAKMEPSNVLKGTLDAMEFLSTNFDEKLAKEPKLISRVDEK